MVVEAVGGVELEVEAVGEAGGGGGVALDGVEGDGGIGDGDAGGEGGAVEDEFPARCQVLDSSALRLVEGV